MNIANAERQAEEILSLQDQWFSEAIDVKTPALFNRLKRVGKATKGTLEVKKCLTTQICCKILHPDVLDDLILEFEFPLDYPSDSVCHVRALSAKELLHDRGSTGESSIEYKSCSEQLQKYLEAFVGCECVEMALDWVSQNKDTCLVEKSASGGDNDTVMVNSKDGKTQCYVLRYNHLLSGPEHKKEKAMMDIAKKSRLQGGLLWGTPGIVVIVPPSTENDANEYSSECRTIGKRPDGVEEVWLPQTGIDEAGLGGLTQQKRGGKLQELDTAGLRSACGGDENLLRKVLGVI